MLFILRESRDSELIFNSDFELALRELFMMGKPPNRYSHNGFWFFHSLRNCASKPLSVLLLLVFLFGNLAFVRAELDVDHHSNQKSSAEFYSLDENQDLNSTPVDCRGSYSCREKAENSYTPFLKTRRSLHQFEIVALLISLKAFSSSEISSLPSTSHYKILFSPRPPPLFSDQA